MNVATSDDIPSQLVTIAVTAAKEKGTPADKLSAQFLSAILGEYGQQEAKESAAMIGFRNLLNAEGGSVGAAEAVRFYGGHAGCTEEAVRKAARAGALISVRDGLGNVLFPVWQFSPRGGVLRGIREVLAELGQLPHRDDLLPLTFFLNPSARLGGRTPLEALRSGTEEEIRQVIALAAEAAE